MKNMKNWGLTNRKYWVHDVEGNLLKTYRIGKWLITENLRTKHYDDYSAIPVLINSEEWKTATKGAMCFYDNDDRNALEHGALYNFYAVDTGKLAPRGWRVPSDEDWKQIELALGMSPEIVNNSGYRGDGIGEKMKELLEVKYSGCRYAGGGGFYNLGAQADWWCSSVSGTGAWYRGLHSSYTSVLRYVAPRSCGFSVRCVRELTQDEILEMDCPAYKPLSGLKDYSDEQLIQELRDRGYYGSTTKTVSAEITHII